MRSSHVLTRRDTLRFSAGALLTAGLWPGALRAADAASGEFRFFCLNDLHCMDEESGRWLESRVVAGLKKTEGAVDFCLLAGDLAEHGTDRELAMVRDVFKTLGMPVYTVPGNHDYVAKDSRATYDELFPGRTNYLFEHKGWQFVALDSTQGQEYHQTSVQSDSLGWLDQQLPKLDKSRPTVLLTHFPLGEGVTYRPKNAEDVLRRFSDYNLRAVLSGHFHGRTERRLRSATLTTNACCALKRNNHDKTKEKGYFLCHAKEGAVSREFVQVG